MTPPDKHYFILSQEMSTRLLQHTLAPSFIHSKNPAQWLHECLFLTFVRYTERFAMMRFFEHEVEKTSKNAWPGIGVAESLPGNTLLGILL